MSDDTIPEPTSMDQLLSMSTDQMRRVGPWQYQGKLAAKRMIRGMVRLLDRELEWQGRANSMSLRGLWYSGVKAALQTAFPDKWSDPSFDANRRYSQYLSEALSEMVKDGEVSYRGLNIVDDSRQRDVAQDTIEDDKILFVEKEAAYRRLEPIQEVFELTLVSGGGWEATALIEDLSNVLDPNQTYQLFVLSDFDPTGYRIAEDFERRSRQLGVNITHVQRIGIEPEQVSDRVREQERFRVPIENDYDEDWLNTYGISDRYGLEIEAIGDRGEGGRPLRKIVTEALEPHLRLRDRIKRDENIAVASTAHWSVERLLEDITDQLRRELLDISTGQLADIDGVDRCYPKDDYSGTRASVAMSNLDTDHRFIPDPLDGDAYLDNAVEAPTDSEGELAVVSVDRGDETAALQQYLREQIETGEIDMNELLGIDS